MTNSFPELFFHQVHHSGDRVALRHKDFGIWNRIYWWEYGQKVREVTAGLLALDLKFGDRVSILGDNRPEWLFCHLGTMTSGAITCGIYSTSSPDEIKYVVEHSESKILFVENEEQIEKVLEVLDDLLVSRVIIWDKQGLWNFSHPQVEFFSDFLIRGQEFLRQHNDSIEERLAQIKPDDTAMIIYTSGTTGRPKGAMISHRNILYATGTFSQVIGTSADDELLSYLPLAHIYENLISVFLAIYSGATVSFVESLDTLAINLREVSPTLFASVPRIWEKFVSMVGIRMADSTPLKRILYHISQTVALSRVRRPAGSIQRLLWNIPYWPLYWTVLNPLKRQLGMERIRFAICGAAPASPELFEWFNAIGVPLREGYGQTESTGVIAAQRLHRPRLGYVGEAVPELEIRISEDGEILVKSEGIFKGYFKAPELTGQTIRDGWLYTGDVGSIDDGFLKIMDRKKDIIITRGGKNITPAYIENKLKFSYYVQDAVVIGDGRRFLTALILIDEENVIKYAQDNLIPFSTFADLTRNEEICKLISREVDKVNKTLSRVETIKKFQLLPRRFYAEDGDVTPTQKVKRRTLEKTYTDLIDAMYRG